MTAGAIPVHVVTGFLGSGKSTLLNALLRRPELADTAVIVNEFGAVGIDHHLIQSAFDRAVLLESGCLCCTLRGDLLDTLGYLIERVAAGDLPAFARVLVETTGLADPGPIMQTLIAEPQGAARFDLGRVVATVGAPDGAATLAAFVEAREQVAVADTVLLTKADLATADDAAGSEAAIRALNAHAPVCRVSHGRIAPERVLRAADGGRAAADGGEGHGHHHAHTAGIASAVVTWDRAVRWADLRAWLGSITSLRGRDLLRIKGLVAVEGYPGPVVIHGVRHALHPPTYLPDWPERDRRTRIVVIARDIPPDALQRSFAAFVSRPHAHAAPLAVRPPPTASA